MSKITAGVDTGGTFTDLIFRDESGFGSFKLLSTPDNPARAVLDGLAHVAGSREKRVIHGSTVATNALLEGKGALTALVTNAGFEDVIEIGRQNRAGLYDLNYHRAKAIVRRELRFGVPGRVSCEGRVIEDFDPGAAAEVAARIRQAGAESVAVCFLFSFLDPSHELAMGEILGRAGLAFTLSHQVLAEFREYERTSTTVVSATVRPVMSRYLGFLESNFGPGDSLSIMQSNGGVIRAAQAAAQPARTVLSGPAGGAVAALCIGRAAGFDKLITFDMGGTSTDVALIDAELPMTTESAIGSYPVKTPMIAIHTVGAGGGSIAAVDAGGALTVGPESAGADPGPACYGKGLRLAVTDANLALGRLLPDRFLGGAMELRRERLDAPLAELAEQCGLSALEVAEGVVTVVNANMERAVRVISVERGFDPAEFSLFSFGGAGGLHAAFLAKSLGIPRVIVPRDPGLLSAKGMLFADCVKDYAATVMVRLASGQAPALDPELEDLAAQARADMEPEGFTGERLVFEPTADVRYKGQSFELTVPFGPRLEDDFHAAHRKRYGYAKPGLDLELVTLRLRARGITDKPPLEPATELSPGLAQGALVDTRPVVFDGKALPTAIIERDKLLPGNSFAGPAVVTEYSSTILVPPGFDARLDALGNIIVEAAS